MKTEIDGVVALLEKRLEAIRRLSQDLVESRRAFVELDMAGVQDHLRAEEELCSDLQMIDRELERLVASLATETKTPQRQNPYDTLQDLFPGSAGERLTSLLAATSAAQLHLQKVNRVQAGMLARFRRTLNALAHLMPTVSGTYEAPKQHSSPMPVWSGT